MPVKFNTSFQATKRLDNGHFQTLFPYFFRRVAKVPHNRVRIETRDKDFLDIDLSQMDSDHLIVLTHGLEGSSNTSYIRGMAKFFLEHGLDVVSWNMRSCSGELNKKPEFYHAVSVGDIDDVVRYCLKDGGYKKVSLIGFSLGGSLTLNYLGRSKEQLPSEICSACVFSTPVCLASSIEKLNSSAFGKVYSQSFLKTMIKKVIQKSKVMDLPISTNGLASINNFVDFDNQITAPLHNFKDGKDYYQKASSRQVIPEIDVPTLIVNAKNDPFLPRNCFPIKEARKNKNVLLEISKSGGHIGFISFNKGLEFWSEQRALDFITKEAA